MAKVNFGDYARPVGWILLGIVVSLMLAGSDVLYGDTLVEWWKPVSGCTVLALISAFVMSHRWSRLTGTDFAPVNFTLHAVVSFSVLIFAFFSVNYFLSDDSGMHKENVVVEHRYMETRYHTRRVNRRVVTRGTPYYVYTIEVRFADGRLKSLSLPKKRYDRIRTGSTISIDVEMGYLGIPVVKSKHSELGKAAKPHD